MAEKKGEKQHVSELKHELCQFLLGQKHVPESAEDFGFYYLSERILETDAERGEKSALEISGFQQSVAVSDNSANQIVFGILFVCTCRCPFYQQEK